MESKYIIVGTGITMPEFVGNRLLYMHKTELNKIALPNEFGNFTPVIENIINPLEDKGNVCYITIDEKIVKDSTHRRAGIHCDFNWYEDIKAYNGGTTETGSHPKKMGNHGHRRMSGHIQPAPAHRPPLPTPSHAPAPNPIHSYNYKDTGGMLLVSNYPACRVYRGNINGEIGEGGDCSKVDITNLEHEVMPSGIVYYLNALGIHEPLKIEGEVKRTLIRINFHPDYVFKAA